MMPVSHGSDTVRRPDGACAPLSTSAIALPASTPSWPVNSTTSARPSVSSPSRPVSLDTGMARPAVTIAITGLPLSFSASTSAYCSSGRPG